MIAPRLTLYPHDSAAGPAELASSDRWGEAQRFECVGAYADAYAAGAQPAPAEERSREVAVAGSDGNAVEVGRVRRGTGSANTQLAVIEAANSGQKRQQIGDAIHRQLRVGAGQRVGGRDRVRRELLRREWGGQEAGSASAKHRSGRRMGPPDIEGDAIVGAPEFLARPPTS